MFKRLFFVFFLFCVLGCAAFAGGKKDFTAPTADTKENEKVSMKWNQVAEMSFGENDAIPAGVPDFNHNGGIANMPILLGLHSFRGIVYGFSGMVQFMCMIFCFLAIVFGVFRMWAGTMETRKMTTNILYNCLLCFLAFWFYVPMTDWVFSLATRLGMTAGGGYTTLNAVYTKTVMDYEKEINEVMPQVLDAILNDGAIEVNGKRYVSADALERIRGVAKIDDIEAYAKNIGVELYYTKTKTGLTYNSMDGSKIADYENPYYVDSNGKEITVSPLNWWGNFWHGQNKSFEEARKKTNNKIASTNFDKMSVRYNSLMEVMSDVTTGDLMMEDNYDMGMVKAHSLENVKALRYAPFLRDKNDKVTEFLAPSLIVKTVSVMSDVLAMTNSNTTDESGANKELEFNPKGIWTWKGLLKTLSTFLYYAVSHLVVLISMLEYTVTLIEFYIVRGIATLVIPLLFLDATKSYASNLIRLMVTYFFKIMVTIFCCFFALSNTLNTLLVVYAGVDMMSNSTTLIFYIFSLMLGASLVLNSGKIASAVMSGNPVIGAGDIAATVRNGIQTAHAVQHLSQGASQAMFGRMGADGKRHGGLLPTGFRAVQGTVNAGRNLSGLNSAAKSHAAKAMADMDTKRSSGEFRNMDNSSFSVAKSAAGTGAYLGTFGQKIGQSVGDGLFKLATGQDRNHLDDQGRNTGFYKVGDQIPIKPGDKSAGTRTATVADVAQQAAKLGGSSADNSVRAVQNFINRGKKSGTELDNDLKDGKHPTKAQSEM